MDSILDMYIEKDINTNLIKESIQLLKLQHKGGIPPKMEFIEMPKLEVGFRISEKDDVLIISGDYLSDRTTDILDREIRKLYGIKQKVIINDEGIISGVDYSVEGD